VRNCASHNRRLKSLRMDIQRKVLVVASLFSWFVPGGLTPAPGDSGSAADGTHLVYEKYTMLAKHSVYPCRCPLSQAVGRFDLSIKKMRATRTISCLITIVIIGHLSACRPFDADKGMIAFISQDDNDLFQIFVMNPDGSDVIQLTTLGENLDPIWSPDGNHIAFFSRSSQNAGWDMYVMNSDGTNQVRLTNSIENGFGPAWSPDGRKIAFISNRDDSEGNYDIYIMNLDGTEPARLTHSPGRYQYYSWSPDGQKIVFSAILKPFRWDIYVVNADGSNLINLTDSPQDDINPIWSPNGKKIIFTSYINSRGLIYIMDADGANQRRLTDDTKAENEEDYSWSPDAKHILYSSNFDIYVINADGSNRTNITSSFDGLCSLPTWSADGHKISFLADLRQPNSQFDIWVIDADGRNLKNITASFNHDVGVPVWSP
jgi:Tol biopolymer transport system component